MCSIAGIIHPQSMTVAVKIAEAMNQAQFHRGPDGGGVWHDEQAVLAHRRLAIIDLAGGAQPMANEDGTLHLVFNGEIYNHIPLRKKLRQAGHLFRTSCDTEVLLHLYEEKGDNFVQDLDGMFAFAFYDREWHAGLRQRTGGFAMPPGVPCGTLGDRRGGLPLVAVCPLAANHLP